MSGGEGEGEGESEVSTRLGTNRTPDSAWQGGDGFCHARVLKGVATSQICLARQQFPKLGQVICDAVKASSPFQHSGVVHGRVQTLHLIVDGRAATALRAMLHDKRAVAALSAEPWALKVPLFALSLSLSLSQGPVVRALSLYLSLFLSLSLALTLALSLSLSRTYAHTHMHTHTPARSVEGTPRDIFTTSTWKPRQESGPDGLIYAEFSPRTRCRRPIRRSVAPRGIQPRVG